MRLSAWALCMCPVLFLFIEGGLAHRELHVGGHAAIDTTCLGRHRGAGAMGSSALVLGGACVLAVGAMVCLKHTKRMLLGKNKLYDTISLCSLRCSKECPTDPTWVEMRAWTGTWLVTLPGSEQHIL